MVIIADVSAQDCCVTANAAPVFTEVDVGGTESWEQNENRINPPNNKNSSKNMHMISGWVDEGKTEGSVGVSGSAATLRKFSHIQTNDMRRMRNF